MIRRSAAVALVGGIAGCGSPDGGAGNETGGAAGGNETGDEEPAQNETGDGGTGDNETGGAAGSEEVEEYLSDTGNYDGTIESMEESEDVTVAVGAEGNEGPYAFEPAAIQIQTGTTVVWEWTGEGGQHNVVEEDGAFDSGEPEDGEEITFEHTFEEAGTYLYVCEPHAGLEMRGAVVVE